MFTLTITEKGGTAATREFDQPEVTIGRIQGNDIVLPKSNISKRHARIIDNNGSFVVIDSRSTNGTYINGKRIDAPYDIKAGDKIFVGDFTMEIDAGESSGKKKAPPPPPPDEDARQKGKGPEGGLLSEDEWGDREEGGLADDWEDDWGPGGEEGAPGDEIEEDPLAASPAKVEEPASSGDDDAQDDDEDDDEEEEDLAGDVDDELAALEAELALDEKQAKKPKAKITSKVKPKLQPKSKPKPKPKPKVRAKAKPGGHTAPGPGGMSVEAAAARQVHERLLRALDLRRMNVEQMDDEELRARTRTAAGEIISAMREEGELPDTIDPDALLITVLDEALGLGPLEELLADDSITEIMVNGPHQIFIERGGQIELAERTFTSDQAVLGVIERIVAPIGRRIDESSPMVDGRLKDGSRVNAIISPLSLIGPVITIRKFTKEAMLVDDLVMNSSLTADMAAFLETCVEARKSILISGGTGSGKTTTLNVLSGFIPDGERIVTIEDAAELKLDQSHVVRLESRPPNIEGRGAITIRDLVRNALRMRPDRIVIGECRGGEALDMLQAMNTGHDGSLTTVHANSPRDALARLETMVLMSGMELPVKAIRDQAASAIDIVVQQSRLPDGSRKITHISEVTGMEADVISMQDIFVFEREGFDEDGKVLGRFKATGYIPRFYESLRAMGLEADLSIFQD